MKNLVLVTLICGGVAQLGTGCIIVGDDDGNNPPPPPPDANEPPPDAEPPPGPGEFLVAWTLLGGDPVDGVQGEVTCPPNGVDIKITADPDPGVADDEDIYLYDCAVGAGPADGLPPGTYDIWIELLDADGTLVAQSDIELGVVLDFDEQIPLDFAFSVDSGTFGIAWIVLANGAPSTCEDIGANGMSLLLTVADNQELSDDFIFDCSAGKGESDPLPLFVDSVAVSYVASLSLIDVGADPIDPGDDTVFKVLEPVTDLKLDYGNDYVDLGTVTFDVP